MKKIEEKYFYNFFRLWVAQFLSKYLICIIENSIIFKENFLKKIITGYLRTRKLFLSNKFYTVGLQIANILNKKRIIGNLKDIFFKKCIDLLWKIISNSKLSESKNSYHIIKNFDKILIRSICNLMYKLKIFYI